MNLDLRSDEYIPLSSQNIVNYNGMLYFPSYTDLISVYEEIKQMNQNGQLVSSAYQYLGIDFNSEYAITENPVSEIFESSLSFNSYRKMEESLYFSFLDEEGDPIDFSSNDLLIDDDFKTLINQYGELKIGKKLFRIYKDNTIFIVGNNDIDEFLASRGQETSELKSDYNSRKKGFVSNDKEYLFNINSQGERIEKDVIDLKIQLVETISGEMHLVNKSFVDLLNSDSHSYKWIFENGSTYLGVNPPNTVSAGESVNLLLYDGNGMLKNSTSIEVRGDDDVCDHLITHRTIRGCTMEIEVFLDWDATTNVIWTLPDGSTRNGTNTTNGNKIIVDTETTDDYYIVKVDIYFNGTQYSDHCFRYYYIKRCHCGDRGSNKDKTKEVTINNRKWRADVEIWVKDTWFVTSVGSKTVSRRKSSWNGIWYKRKCDLLYASFKGIIQEADKNACPSLILPFTKETEKDGNHLERNVSVLTKDPRYIKNMQICESTHWFKESGVTVSYLGKLFLD